jgi:erythromycin esterase
VKMAVDRQLVRWPRHLALLVLSALSVADAGVAQEVPHTFIAWARQNAVRIATLEPSEETADLQQLKAAIGQARVVALGEAAHGSHEFLAFRNRLFEFLVDEMGFTAIAVETGLSEAMQVEEYIGGGAGNATALAQAVFCTNPERLEENRQLIEWMHSRNAANAGGRKIRLYGIDLTGMREGEFPEARLAVDRALAYLHEVEPASAQRFRERLEPLLARFSSTAFGTLSEAQQDALTTTIEELVSLLGRRQVDFLGMTPSSRYDNALRHAINARQVTDYFRTARADAAAKPLDLRESFMVRDAAMAENVRWVLEREGREGRILVFAHNMHVKKGPTDRIPLPVFPGRAPSSMGEYLRSSVVDGLFVIGSCFAAGAQELTTPLLLPGSLDAALSDIGPSPFLLVLRSVATGQPAGEWLNHQRKMRANDRYVALNPRTAFDALLFINETTATRVIR